MLSAFKLKGNKKNEKSHLQETGLDRQILGPIKDSCKKVEKLSIFKQKNKSLTRSRSKRPLPDATFFFTLADNGTSAFPQSCPSPLTLHRERNEIGRVCAQANSRWANKSVTTYPDAQYHQTARDKKGFIEWG